MFIFIPALLQKMLIKGKSNNITIDIHEYTPQLICFKSSFNCLKYLKCNMFSSRCYNFPKTTTGV